MIWVEWVEPYVDSDPVYMRVSKETAIKAQRQCHEYGSNEYPTDEEVLQDFISVHWASVKEE